MNIIYLSRRNLLTLLAKLERVKNGERSACTVIKNDTVHKQYPCTTPTAVIAVEDDIYYTDREPGPTDDAPVMHIRV